MFNNIGDVYSHFEAVYDDSLRRESARLGESIYLQGAFFYDLMLFLDQDCQDRIKEFTFCKTFNCPPFKSLDDTPDRIKDSFFIIDQEYNNCVNHTRENTKDK